MGLTPLPFPRTANFSSPSRKSQIGCSPCGTGSTPKVRQPRCRPAVATWVECDFMGSRLCHFHRLLPCSASSPPQPSWKRSCHRCSRSVWQRPLLTGGKSCCSVRTMPACGASRRVSTLQSSSRGKNVSARVFWARFEPLSIIAYAQQRPPSTSLSRPIDLTLGAEGRRGSRVERRESLEANLQLAHNVLDDTKLHIVDVSWLSDDTMLCGSAEGRVRGTECRTCPGSFRQSV